MKLRHANYNEIPARSTCHASREKAVLDSIAFRKHDTQRLFLSCAKKSFSNLHVVDMPLNEPTIWFSFYHAVLRDLSDSRETKNILGPKINPPNFQALISPSPEIFPCRFYMIWYAKKWKVNVCGWFIHGTICWILLFLIWQSELCGQHCTRAVLPQSDCFEYPLKLVLK